MNESYKHYINEKLKNTLFHLYEVQNIAKPKINCIGILTYLKKSGKKPETNKYSLYMAVTWWI